MSEVVLEENRTQAEGLTLPGTGRGKRRARIDLIE